MKGGIAVVVVFLAVGNLYPTPGLSDETRIDSPAPVTFEEALPEEPASATFRWVADHSRARQKDDGSLTIQRAQGFFGLVEGMSGEIELPVLRVASATGSPTGLGNLAVGLKLAPRGERSWPVAIRLEAELATADHVLPEEVRSPAGGIALAASHVRGGWTLQGDLGYEAAWNGEARSLEFNLATIRRMNEAFALHFELAGERELGEPAVRIVGGPAVSVRSESGLTLGAAAQFGWTADSQGARFVAALGREF